MAKVVEILLKEPNGYWRKHDDIMLNILDNKGEKNILSFITYKGNQQLINDNDKGFCHIKFKANFTIDNIKVEDLTQGQILKIGDTNINIIKVSKSCYSNCPVIKKNKVSCSVNKEIFWGEVLSEGKVNIKDNVTFI